MTPGARAADRRFLLGLVLGFCALTALPTVVATVRTPPSQRFTGLVTHPYDQAYYVASERGAATDATRTNRFTSELGAPGPISPLYPALGQAERALGLRPTSLFHLPQLLGAPLLVLLVWWIAGLVHSADATARRWAAILALFGAGVGSVASGAIAERSADRSVTELSPLFSLAVMPHFTVAYLGLALVWGAILTGVVGRRARITIPLGALGGILLAVSHGFLLLPAVLGSAMLTIVLSATGRRREALGTGAAGAAALVAASPLLLTLAREQNRFEVLQGRPFPSRPADAWWTWVVAQPILLALLVMGAVVIVRSGAGRRPALWAAGQWCGLQGAMIFLPITVFQRRFSEGIVLPAALLAGAGAAWMLRDQRWSAHLALSTLLIIPSALLLWQAGSSALYLDQPTTQLAASLGPDDVVLAGATLSWQLPAISAATSYLGRDVETLRHGEKRAAASRFLADPQSIASRRWLSDTGITAIVIDDRDSSMADPAAAGATCFTQTAFSVRLRILRPIPGCTTTSPG